MYIAAMKSRDDKPPRAWNSTIAQRTKPMNRGTGPKRSARLASEIAPSRKPVRKSNPKRKAKEFQRAYGGEERVEWVKTLPCIVCGPHCRPIENVHVETGGTSRKANADKIVPMCQLLHRVLHHVGVATFERNHGVYLEEAAARTEYLWQAECARRGLTTP